MVAQRKLLVQGVQHFLGDGFCLSGRHRGIGVQFFQHDHELVATEAGHGIDTAHTLLQTLGHLLEQQIAHVVAEGVVEYLEIVEVDKQQAPVLAVAVARRQGQPEAVQKHPPVRQACERIKKSEALDFRLCGFSR